MADHHSPMVALEAFSPPAPLEEGSVTHDVSCILVEDDRNSTGLSEKWEPLKAELPEYVKTDDKWDSYARTLDGRS